MSTMVVRVARAIERAGWKYARQQAVGNIPDMCEEMARAAVEAMKEPTPAMDSAGYDAYPDSAIRTGVDHLDIYRAMIQAALKESA